MQTLSIPRLIRPRRNGSGQVVVLLDLLQGHLNRFVQLFVDSHVLFVGVVLNIYVRFNAFAFNNPTASVVGVGSVRGGYDGAIIYNGNGAAVSNGTAPRSSANDSCFPQCNTLKIFLDDLV